MLEKLKSKFNKKKKSTFPTASTERRNVYVNMELPLDEQDDYGQPTTRFISNNIRTAKYTWYTFLPKNLFEQFRGIANIYFLFLVILQMFPLFSTSASPVLVILPLAAILVLTGAKDAFEDNKRFNTDESVNKAVTYTLSDWKNVNLPVYKVARWKRFLNRIKRIFTRDKKRELLMRMETGYQESKLSLRQTLKSKASAVFKPHKMRYRPGQVPHSVLRRSVMDPEMPPPLQRQSTRIRQPIDKRWKRTLWEDIEVGDFVYLRNNDAVPADMIVLSSSEPDGLCYVETQNLDGETNLKIKHSLQATNEIRTPSDCERSKFYVESEPPHANLYSYNGVLKWKVEDVVSSARDVSQDTAVELDTIQESEEDLVFHEKTEAITSNSVLLRGCVLRNTGWVMGLAMFTGNETKIMLNSGKTPSKRSKMEKKTNPYVIFNFILLLVLCLICSIAASVVYNSKTSSTYFESPDAENGTMEGFIMFWTTLVIYQNIIPISLYISVQIVKTAAAYFIHTDLDMYNERLDLPCTPKTWNISDDLGQIEYIFSDKTGTLTQNIMEFKKCTINGVSYGLGETEASIGAQLRDMAADSAKITHQLDMDKARAEMMAKQSALFDHKYINREPTFVDPKLYDDLALKDAQSQSVVHFFSALALCHTVIPELDEKDQMEYKAQSPDEAALVATARDLGFTFLAREQDHVAVDIMGEQRTMVLLHVLEFNSTRKRMSVIMRSPQDGQLILLCKGADSVIYERLSEGLEDLEDEASKHQVEIRKETLEHLAKFANEGLRTLCIASRVLEEDVYQEWAQRYKLASNSIRNRDEEIEKVCEEIETSLTLIGGTAIEDKLQEGVPDTIGILAESGIKLWVLTGDKVETAINIGFACNLLTRDMLLISISSKSEEETMEQLISALKEIKENEEQAAALIIDGESLKFALEVDACRVKLLTLGTQCRAVVCCRVSPMQKAKVVNMVKKGLKVMTLAIGDGANDVSMIQEANVGIGISGEEGRQAVMASDYAIAQFRYLGKLLLVHGRWSYLRTSEMILTFFYKNIMWTLVLFWYQLMCGFTGTMMFDYSYITLYNLVFTSLPCIFAGIFDQDLKSEYSFKFPQLYLMGVRNDKFTASRFYLTVVDAIYQSAICFGLPYMVFIGPKSNHEGYDTEGVIELGTFIAGIAVVVANALVGSTIFSWTWIMFLCITLSSATYFIWVGIYSNVMTFTFYGEDIVFRQASFWLCLLLTFVVSLMPRLVTKYYLHMYYPYDNDIIREMVLCSSSQKSTTQIDEEQIPMARSYSDHSVASTFRRKKDRLTSRLTRTLSGRSEIMNMKTGKRQSFNGFAYSSDDHQVFDDYRKSVYRTNTTTSRLSIVSTTPSTRRSEKKKSDWMPLGDLPLRKNFGQKMFKVVKDRMRPKQNQQEQIDLVPLQSHYSTHRESSHHDPLHTIDRHY
ncbi:hypothetical protein G6F56_001821 [Rhizopus delemar]|nr:hypothetical protein G6F56_001821 [Rhizopus delemar]